MITWDADNAPILAALLAEHQQRNEERTEEPDWLSFVAEFFDTPVTRIIGWGLVALFVLVVVVAVAVGLS